MNFSKTFVLFLAGVSLSAARLNKDRALTFTDPNECYCNNGAVTKQGTAECSCKYSADCANIAHSVGDGASATAGLNSGDSCISATARGVRAIATGSGTSHVIYANGDGALATASGLNTTVTAEGTNSTAKAAGTNLVVYALPLSTAKAVNNEVESTVTSYAPGSKAIASGGTLNVVTVNKGADKAYAAAFASESVSVTAGAASSTVTAVNTKTSVLYSDATAVGAEVTSLAGSYNNSMTASAPDSTLVANGASYSNVMWTEPQADGSILKVKNGAFKNTLTAKSANVKIIADNVVGKNWFQ